MRRYANNEIGLRRVMRASEIRSERSLIYFVTVRGVPDFPIKIGRSTVPGLVPRLISLQTALPYPLQLLATLHGGVDREKRLHARFAELHLTGEWFRRGPELLALIREVGTVVPYPKKFAPER